jgi:hypothetical protein
MIGVINKLSDDSSPGEDGIQNRFLKKYETYLNPNLPKLFFEIIFSFHSSHIALNSLQNGPNIKTLS